MPGLGSAPESRFGCYRVEIRLTGRTFELLSDGSRAGGDGGAVVDSDQRRRVLALVVQQSPAGCSLRAILRGVVGRDSEIRADVLYLEDQGEIRNLGTPMGSLGSTEAHLPRVERTRGLFGQLLKDNHSTS